MRFQLDNDRSGRLWFSYPKETVVGTPVKGKVAKYGRDVFCTVEIGSETVKVSKFIQLKNFDKRESRKKALGKAIRELPRQDRARIWHQYWVAHKTNRQVSMDRYLRKNAWRVDPKFNKTI